ncbi:Inositol-1-monophosphatase [Pirellulimonas nuda]|uniref:Inositol-1-monophosphatase n=1 Tax=Pirellulimonas nuda TaxID=2528009 RepID=A0A518DHX4_9BACT|nr:inositol monophosphatase family protein [Pirellulimonas nuda]QDU91083.1 Inositol-1-monophosphatase [Pirellulimonas nuda]
MSDSPAALLEIAIEAARRGGVELVQRAGRFEARLKGAFDFVTDADEASQHAIEAVIRRSRPDDVFVGEEGEASERRPDEGELAWVADPLDGTMNFVHGFPCYAVSVGVTRGDRLQAGAIYDPNRDELFAASLRGGAFLEHAGTRRPMRVTASRSIDQAMLAMSLPANVAENSPDLLDFVRLAPRCQAVRRIGSAALNLAYLACGRIDGHWAREIKPWDVAAGVLLVTEAGGEVCASDGGAFDLWKADFVAASTPALHAELLAALTVAAPQSQPDA